MSINISNIPDQMGGEESFTKLDASNITKSTFTNGESYAKKKVVTKLNTERIGNQKKKIIKPNVE